MNDILNKLKTKLPNHSTIVIAVSGGPDSMVLLSLLYKIKKEKNLKLICAHVNHKLRKESEEEAKMLKTFCTHNNIIFEYMEINEYKGNKENYARKKRYEFFEKLIKKYSSSYLLTAHHGDDLTETIMMRLIRGSSLKGYAGFNEITEKENYKIIRPLITKTKEEILNYAIKNNIPYAIDKTNNSDVFTRNRIRKYILPKLKEENKSVHLKFLEFSKKLTETEKFLEKITKEKLKQIYKEKIIDINLLKNEDELIQKQIIHHILNKTYKDNINKITNEHVNNIMHALKSKNSNKKINLPNNKIFIKSYNKAWIEENKTNNPYDIILNKKLTISNKDIIEIIDETMDHSNYVTKINSKDIKLPLHVRTKKDGDKLILKGINKTKKIKDIFIDEKIPITERTNWPIVTDDNDEIIWLPGLKKTKFDREKDQNYDIIIRYQKKGSL